MVILMGGNEHDFYNYKQKSNKLSNSLTAESRKQSQESFAVPW